MLLNTDVGFEIQKDRQAEAHDIARRAHLVRLARQEARLQKRQRIELPRLNFWRQVSCSFVPAQC